MSQEVTKNILRLFLWMLKMAGMLELKMLIQVLLLMMLLEKFGLFGFAMLVKTGLRNFLFIQMILEMMFVSSMIWLMMLLHLGVWARIKQIFIWEKHKLLLKRRRMHTGMVSVLLLLMVLGMMLGSQLRRLRKFNARVICLQKIANCCLMFVTLLFVRRRVVILEEIILFQMLFRQVL